jgi:chromosome segregation ATPase
LAGETLTAPQIAAKLETLEAAREERDSLREKLEAETEALNAVVSRTADAAGNLKHWTAEVDRCTGEAKAARAQIETLAQRCTRPHAQRWDDVVARSTATPHTSTAASGALQKRAARAIGSCEQRIKQIDRTSSWKELTKRGKGRADGDAGPRPGFAAADGRVPRSSANAP